MKKVFVCSPFAGNIAENVDRARDYCRIEIARGNMPIAPHLLYPQFMDDSDPHQRELGIRMGLELLKTCDELHVYGPRISTGMAREIAVWREMGNKEIRYQLSVIVKEI